MRALVCESQSSAGLRRVSGHGEGGRGRGGEGGKNDRYYSRLILPALRFSSISAKAISPANRTNRIVIGKELNLDLPILKCSTNMAQSIRRLSVSRFPSSSPRVSFRFASPRRFTASGCYYCHYRDIDFLRARARARVTLRDFADLREKKGKSEVEIIAT